MRKPAHDRQPKQSRDISWYLVYIVLCFGALSCFLFGYRYATLPFLRGYDSYYYAVQADWWFLTGSFRVPDDSLALYGPSIIRVLNESGEGALKLWVSLSLFLFLLSFVLMISRRSLNVLSFGGIIWILISPSLAFSAIEFPKNFIVLIFMNLWFWVAFQKKTRWVALLALIALTSLFHKMALVYAFVFLVGFIPRLRVLSRVKIDWKKLLPAVLFMGIALAFVIVYFSYSVGFDDLQRIVGRKWVPGVVSLFFQPGLPAAIKYEFILAALLLASVVLFGGYRNLLNKLPFVLLLLTTFFPSMGSEAFSIGERFGLFFPYFSVVLFYFLIDSDNPCQQETLPKTEKHPFDALLARLYSSYITFPILLLAALAGYVRLDYSFPKYINPPYGIYHSISKELSRFDIPMLIVHRGQHYYYKYITQREAFSFEPETHWNKKRIWRLVYGVKPEELFAYFPKSCVWDVQTIKFLSAKNYTLVREDCYYGLRENVSREMNPELYALLWESAMNPSQPRPKFLYKRHRADDDDEFPALPKE